MHRNNKPMAGGVKAIPYGAHKSIFNCLELTFQNKYQKKKMFESHMLWLPFWTDLKRTERR